MAITYPLEMPSNVCIASITLRQDNAVAVERSPFTFAQQVQASAGQMWMADVILPPMRRDKAAEWQSFLTALRGPFGTFLLGDPNAVTARGLAASFPGNPVINNQTGGTIAVTGASPSKAGWLLAGDYIQIGSGATATMHMVLQDATTDAAGATSLNIWPHVRGTRSDAVVVSNARGRFRLSESASFSRDNLAVYGITFSAEEVVP